MTSPSLRFIFSSTLLVMLGGVALHAQTFDHQVKAKVPFRFTVGAQTLPAGAYRITRVGDQGAVLIQSDDLKTGVIVSTHSTTFKEPQENTVLLFNRYGDDYFLSQIRTVGEDSGVELFPSKKQRNLSMTLSAIQVGDRSSVAGM